MQSRGNNKKIQMSKYMVYIVLAVVFVFFAITLRDNGFCQHTEPFKHFKTDSYDLNYVSSRCVCVKCRPD